MIGIVSSYNEIVPGHMNIDKKADAVKQGVFPGLLMAAARLNIPSFFISGGPMLAGEYQGNKISYSERLCLAKEAGMQIMELVKRDIKPRNIMTKNAYLNALVIDMALRFHK